VSICCVVSENPALSDVYISDEEGPAEPVVPLRPAVSSLSSTTNNNKQTASSTTATTQPAVVTGKVNNSHKKNSEPLPPIPQHHYDQAARQIQQSRHATVPAALVDDKKMECVLCFIIFYTRTRTKLTSCL